MYCKPNLPRIVREWAEVVISGLGNRPIAYFRGGLILTTQKKNEATSPWPRTILVVAIQGCVKLKVVCVSILLEVLGRGLGSDLHEMLGRFYWDGKLAEVGSSPSQPLEDSSRPNPDLESGLAHWRESRLGEAQESLVRACRQDSENIRARAALACVFDEAGDVASALEQLRALDRLKPAEAIIQFSMGLCCERVLPPADAADYYRRAIELDEEFVLARERLAAVRLHAGDTAETIRQYQAICRLVPENTRLRTLLGALLCRAGEYDSAIEEFESAIVMGPDNWALQDVNCLQLVAEGKIHEAIEDTHQAIKMQGPFADLHLRLGDLYSLSSDDALARKHYLKTLDIQPFYLEALIRLATHHLLFGRWEESAETFGRAAELSECVVVDYLGMGVAQAAAGQKENAANSFDLAVAVEPNNTLLHSQMIRLHWKVTRADEMIQWIDQFRNEGQPPDSPGNDSLLRDELECHAERVGAEPLRADVRLHYGVLLRSAGRLTEATQQFAYAVKLHPTYLPALVKLGVSLKELNHDRHARGIFCGMFDTEDQQIDFHYRLAVQFSQRRPLDEIA